MLRAIYCKKEHADLEWHSIGEHLNGTFSELKFFAYSLQLFALLIPSFLVVRRILCYYLDQQILCFFVLRSFHYILKLECLANWKILLERGNNHSVAFTLCVWEGRGREGRGNKVSFIRF